MIRNIVFDMGNVLLRFDREYFRDAVGAQGADRKLLLNNVYRSLEWARMDRGSMKRRTCWWTGGTAPFSRFPAWSSWLPT